MKKINLIILPFFLLAFIFYSCDNKRRTEGTTGTGQGEGRSEVNEGRTETSAEFQEFKRETEASLERLDQKIERLKQRSNGSVNNETQKEIEEIEMERDRVRDRINASDNENTMQENWEEFKSDVNRSINELERKIDRHLGEKNNK